VKFLGPGNGPASWPRIQEEKPFKGHVNRTLSEAESNPKKSQGHLSTLASQYRAWIEELEAKEDAMRAKLEKQRQQGLANARNELRELQQRQDQISTDLDRAAERSADVQQKWPAARAGENTNVDQAQGLLGKLQALSPTAGERLKAAIQSMQLALSAGEGSKWVDAESAADLAGRLLRDADQAANKSQKQQGRGRRRRSGGDEYHGTSIGGQVEIKSEYQVDPRYREHILRDVEEEISDGENKAILDGWLHEVVR
jgi:chromosome segregation ATPase